MMCYIGVCLFCVVASTNGMGTPSPVDSSNQGTGSCSDLASVKDDVHKVHVSLTRELGNLNVDLTNKITAEIRASRREIEERLGGQMNKLEERLGLQMTSLEERLGGQMNNLEERLDGKIDKVDGKIDKV